MDFKGCITDVTGSVFSTLSLLSFGGEGLTGCLSSSDAGFWIVGLSFFDVFFPCGGRDFRLAMAVLQSM